jgi:hypothetical protein
MPNRVIKESIFSSPNLNRLNDSSECLFYRLLLITDDHGCFEATPDFIRGKCFSKKANNWGLKKIINSLVDLANNELIFLWTENEHLYGIFLTFKNHQRVRSLHNRKTPKPPRSLNVVSVNDFLRSFVVNCQQVTDKCRQVSSSDRLNPKPKPNLKPNLNHNPNLKKLGKKLKPQNKLVTSTEKNDSNPEIDVLKLAFLKKFKSNPFPYFDNDDYREKAFEELNTDLKLLVDRVKGNIDIFLSDMDAVSKNGKTEVGTMLYFIKSQHGASRWDKLASEFTFTEHAKLKQEWIDALEKNDQARQLAANLTARGQPDHVERAINEYKKLYQKYELEQNPTEKDMLRNQIRTYQHKFGFG